MQHLHTANYNREIMTTDLGRTPTQAPLLSHDQPLGRSHARTHAHTHTHTHTHTDRHRDVHAGGNLGTAHANEQCSESLLRAILDTLSLISHTNTQHYPTLYTVTNPQRYTNSFSPLVILSIRNVKKLGRLTPFKGSIMPACLTCAHTHTHTLSWKECA